MVWTNRTENVETRAPGHLEIENHGVRFHLLDAANRFRHVARLSCKLDARHVPQELGQTLGEPCRLICDKALHFLLPPSRPSHLCRLPYLPELTSLPPPVS